MFASWFGSRPRFRNRSARYALQNADESQVRFCSRQSGGRVLLGRCVDVSETGMRLVNEDSGLGKIGEDLRVEFKIPSLKMRVSGAARIVRIDDTTPSWSRSRRQSIAVEFIGFGDSNRKALAAGLLESQKRLALEQMQKRLRDGAGWLGAHAGTILLMAGSLGAMFLIFAAVLTPQPGEDPTKPVPWGQRYGRSSVAIDNFIYYQPTESELSQIAERLAARRAEN